MGDVRRARANSQHWSRVCGQTGATETILSEEIRRGSFVRLATTEGTSARGRNHATRPNPLAIEPTAFVFEQPTGVGRAGAGASHFLASRFKQQEASPVG